MSESPRQDLVNTNVGLLSDDDLYQIYIKALGYPKRRFGGRADKMYLESSTKRQLTALDAMLYFLLLLLGASQANSAVALLLLIGCIVSLINYISGPFALCGLLYYTAQGDQLIEPPSRLNVNLHSPDVLYFVAEYLTRPILDNARTLTKHFEAEQVIVEKFHLQTSDLAAKLEEELQQLTDKSLISGYERRIQDATRTRDALAQKRDAIAARIQMIHDETMPIERPLTELKILSQAGQRLRTIQGLTGESRAGQDEDSAAMDNFAGLRARLEMAKQNIAGLGASFGAYEDAVLEVQRLGVADDH